MEKDQRSKIIVTLAIPYITVNLLKTVTSYYIDVLCASDYLASELQSSDFGSACYGLIYAT
jgi:hypothetical protein